MTRWYVGPLGQCCLTSGRKVPEVLGAVKRAVGRGAPPGSFVLTGSVRAPLRAASWPGTGRTITIEMRPLTVLEQRSTGAPRSDFLDRVLSGRFADLDLPPDGLDLVGYVDLAVAGGYPPALGLSAKSRQLWLDSYVEQLILRDVPELGEIRESAALRRLLRALVESTCTLTADTELAAAADMNVKTVRRQERLLEDLRIVLSLPAWHTNRISRLIKQRKRYAVDTGLVACMLETDVRGVLNNGDLLGRMLETFVLAQLRPLVDTAGRRVSAHHLRQQDGRREVDVVLEAADGRVVGIEIRASAGPAAYDARYLAWLRDQLGERFAAGIVLHTGKAIYPLGEMITAVPISALWRALVGCGWCRVVSCVDGWVHGGARDVCRDFGGCAGYCSGQFGFPGEEPAGGYGHAECGDHRADFILDRCGGAMYVRDGLSRVEGTAGKPDPLEFGGQHGRIGDGVCSEFAERGSPAESAIQFAGIPVGEQDFSCRAAVGFEVRTYPRAEHVDDVVSDDLVYVEHRVALHHGEVDGLAHLVNQALHDRPGVTADVGGGAQRLVQFDDPPADPVSATATAGQQPGLGQARQERVSVRPWRFDRCGGFRDTPFGPCGCEEIQDGADFQDGL